VDGNIERVIARLYAVETPLPAAKPEINRLARGLTPQKRAGDFAQAMMDLGATICTPKTPACALCPWNDACAGACARGDAGTFPRRAPKREGALRRGAAFVARRADGMVLVRTRPAKGLLGGMTEVPTTAWSKDFDDTQLHDTWRCAEISRLQNRSSGSARPGSFATSLPTFRSNSRSIPPSFRLARRRQPIRAGSKSRRLPARPCRP
jgi:A/G-specific adenine glycosylase